MALSVCGSHWLRMQFGTGEEKNLAAQVKQEKISP